MRANRLFAAIKSVVRWTAIPAGAATIGALVGACFGGVLGLLYRDPAVFLPVVVYFSACAAASGAILAMFISGIDGLNALVPARRAPRDQRTTRMGDPRALPAALAERARGLLVSGRGAKDGATERSAN